MCFHIQQIPQEKIKIAGHELMVRKEVLAKTRNFYTVSGFAFPELLVIVGSNPYNTLMMKWGLIPFWTKTEQQANELRTHTLNAKCETLFEKPAFRCAVSKRCILPVNGFFEWHTKGKNKFPFFIYPAHEDYFFIACVFDEWTNKDTGEFLQTFSIVTNAANKTMATIHNSKQRMPLILNDDDINTWLDPTTPKTKLAELFKPFDDAKLKYHTISKLITSRKENANVPEVTKPYEYNELINFNIN
jgi:putative SOS response-associated peptidase YedK